MGYLSLLYLTYHKEDVGAYIVHVKVLCKVYSLDKSITDDSTKATK